MNYAFAIDHRKCIGCHACTTACKSENEVPLGVFRTWVKYVEKGSFPDVRRYFTVLRCNHCDNPPCVHICPTRALFKRTDGIVDFDNDSCISCRSCMAACPYDAIYMDPNTQTVAKCHYCAHRIEVGLQPACVVVCPEQAIICGDLDDSSQELSRLIQQNPLTTRKPEKGTEPKVFYIDADESALTPGESIPQSTSLWGERPGADGERSATPQPQDSNRPVEAYDVAHEKAWGGLVSAYLWTKSIAAGALLVSGLAAAFDVFDLFTVQSMTNLAGPGLALIFLTLTTVILIADLGQPRRFMLILLHPNWRSWLVWGAYILLLFGLVCFAWVGLFPIGKETPPWYFSSLSIAVSVATAGYSAFLLAQAKARDLWQSPMSFLTLILHALTAGSAAHLIVAVIGGFPQDTFQPLLKLMSSSLVLALGVILLELTLSHGNKQSTVAAGLILRGKYAQRFWLGSVLCGIIIPLLATLGIYLGTTPAFAQSGALLAGVLVLMGVLIHEDIWIRAGQDLPLS